MKHLWKRVLTCLTIPAMLMGVLPVSGLVSAEETAVTTIESIQVNQVGYLLGAEKTFMVSRTKTADDDQDMTFELIDATGKAVYTGDMVKEVTPYEGTDHEWPSLYYSGDFTAYDVAGTYTLTAVCGNESVTSCSFRIGDATTLYSEALYATLAYFRGERDTANTQIKNQYNNDTLIDLHGAWYDASNRPAVYMGYIDNYNYMVCNIESNTSYQLFNAYEANPAIYDAIDYNHNGIADIIEEAVWGCDWYVRLKPSELTGGYFYNGPEHGKIHSNESVKAPVSIRMGAGSAIAALARAARYGVDGAFTAKEYGEHAKEAWEWYIVNNETLACEDGMEHLMDDIYWAVAALDMYQTFKEQKYLDVAIERVDAIMDRQTGDENFDGWFELGMEEKYDNTDGGPYHNWLDEAAVLYPLIDYAKAFPEDTDRVARIKNSVEKYMDFKLAVSNDDSSGSNPYDCAKYYFREEVTDPDSTLVRFFQHENGHPTSGGPVTNSWVSGENGRLLSLTYASLLVDDFLDTDKYLNYGLAQLNWVYGLNPFSAVMQAGIGEGRNLAEEIGFGGTVPYGAFINGIRGDYKNKVKSSAGYMDSRDYPFIDNSYWTGEWFLPIGTDAIMALTKLMSVSGEAATLPKDVPCEAEDAEYLLTTQHGSNRKNDGRFEITAVERADASGGKVLTGIDQENEGVLFVNAPQATSLTVRYAAAVPGSIHLYVNNKVQTVWLPATGSANDFGEISIWTPVQTGATVSLQYLSGDAPISLDYVVFKNEKIVSVDGAVATTLVGEKPQLPEAVTATYSDGTTGWQEVVWQEPAASDYADPGVFTVNGTLANMDKAVTAIVTVYQDTDEVWIKPASVATSIDALPELPATVSVYYPNGQALERAVVWDTVTAAQVAQTGRFTVSGQIDGLTASATADVTVLAPFPEGTSDLAYRKYANAAGYDADNRPANAVDGDMTTRWASPKESGEVQWLELDLGKSYRIGSAAIFWETAYASAYTIEVSEDRETWTQVYATDSSNGGTDNIAFDLVEQGRYVRINCSEYGYAAWKAYSIYEIRLYGEAGAPIYVPATGLEILSDTAVLNENAQEVRLTASFSPENVSIDEVVWSVTDENDQPTDCAIIDYTGALKAQQNGLVKVTATAVDGSGVKASRLFLIQGQDQNLALGAKAEAELPPYQSVAGMVDGDLTTRWAGKFNAPDQWAQIDLGTAQPFNTVVIYWENSYATAYELLASNDGEEWTELYTTTAGTGGIERIRFDEVTARYVRLHSAQAASPQWGVSVWEFEVYNNAPTVTTAADVAEAIGEGTDPLPAATQMILPSQSGFDTAISASSNEAVIGKDGAIAPVAEDTEVTLTLTITNQQDPSDTAIVTMTVTVSGLGEEWAALRQELATLEEFEAQAAYTQGSSENRSAYQVAKQLAESVDAQGDVAAPLRELALELLQTAKEMAAIKLGDVNLNGEVTAEDALMALQAATGKIDLTADQTAAANVDKADGIAANDALMILQYATQKITGF